MLSDGRLSAGTASGICSIYKLPEEVEDIIGEYTKRKYSPLFRNIPFLSPPLKHMYARVKEKSVAILQALSLVTDPKLTAAQ